MPLYQANMSNLTAVTYLVSKVILSLCFYSVDCSCQWPGVRSLLSLLNATQPKDGSGPRQKEIGSMGVSVDVSFLQLYMHSCWTEWVSRLARWALYDILSIPQELSNCHAVSNILTAELRLQTNHLIACSVCQMDKSDLLVASSMERLKFLSWCLERTPIFIAVTLIYIGSSVVQAPGSTLQIISTHIGPRSRATTGFSLWIGRIRWRLFSWLDSTGVLMGAPNSHHVGH